MDENSGGGGPPGWNPADQFQAHSTTGVYTSASNQQQQPFPVTSQGGVAQFAESQFQALTQGAFQPVYQAAQSSYDRISPVNVGEYPTSANGADSLHQYRALSTDGTSIIRVSTIADSSGNPQSLVTVLLSNGTLATATPQAAAQLQQMVPVSIETPASLSQQMSAPSISLPSLPSSVSMATAGMASSSLGAPLVRDHVVSQLEADSGGASVSHSQDALLQVVTSLPQLTHVESTTSEATPLLVHGDAEADTTCNSISIALHQGVTGANSSKVEAYASEPDTTQEDLEPTYHHTVHHHQDVYQEVESSGHPTSHLDLCPVSTPNHLGLGHASTMENVIVSTAADCLTSHPVSMATMASAQPAMDPSIDTSGIIAQTTSGTDGDLDLLVPNNQQVIHIQPCAPLPSTSHDVTNHDVHGVLQGGKDVRKSLRIANLDRPGSPFNRPHYQSKGYYNPQELWCEECQVTYQNDCPRHRMQLVYDKVVLSRAWASLPTMLQIFRLGESSDLGVFARKAIAKRTQLGPFIGELVGSRELVSNQRFVLQLDRENGETFYFEASDENKCNWMMFVRPAETWAEQNMVAYQYNGDIYYTTIKTIEAKQELKVWYAAPYAERLGVGLLELRSEDMVALDEADNRWPCYECSKRFKTSALLQKHLTVHDDSALPGNIADEMEDEDDEADKKYLRGTRKRGTAVRQATQKKNVKNDVGPEEAGNSFQSWKKMKTSIYLHKYKKYHQETIKKSIKSLYKKKGKESGGQEWVCTNCDLTFDNASLLNLHTLTHAAEDIGLQEIRKLVGDGEESTMLQELGVDSLSPDGADNIVSSQQETILECPVCRQQFDNKVALIQHASEHGKAKKRLCLVNPSKPYKCNKCWKAFSGQERLTRHMLCHGDEDSKPLQCNVCLKRFMNNSALSCHLKTHSDKKYYECPLCKEGFDQMTVMKDHVFGHAINGVFTCPECHKAFTEYNGIRKHMRAFHSDRKYNCTECDKVFPRPDKLKLHMLRHSAHREFMCETCGRQFKRKDKLKEHMKRMHVPDRDRKPRPARTVPGQKKFIPKVSPNDYHRFIYKCHSCLLGFKRRGMLVNHLAKRHPDMRPEQVPELNLPILRTQRDYFCQYCDKVYKSSSKRKAHIMKNHPGSELPLSSRKKGPFMEMPGIPNPTYSQTVGNVTTVPHPCEFCHKQYASKAKLLQHQRKKHTGMVPPAQQRRAPSGATIIRQGKRTAFVMTTVPPPADAERFDSNVQVVGQQVVADAQADLLTQAMSELTQTFTLNDYRPAETYESVGTQRIAIQAPAILQSVQPTTIELSHLGQTLAQTHYQVNQSIQASQAQAASTPDMSSQTLTTDVTAQGQSEATTPITIAPVDYLPRSWAPTTNYTSYR